ncbi:TNF receptor-associated factor 3-like [Oscarella lobularis]|uniref:TNF receptor-associated factor 3-like n=1 Tax=Oscarella lobularis TaxID=121494 RepID=UPI0033141C0F
MWLGKKALLERHMKDECQYRHFMISLIRCRVCSQDVSRGKLSEHLKLSCPEKDVSCEVPGCARQLKRKALSAHNRDSVVEHIAHITKAINETMKTLSSLQLPSDSAKATAAIESLRIQIDCVEKRQGIQLNQRIAEAENLARYTSSSNIWRRFALLTEEIQSRDAVIASYDVRLAQHDVRLAQHDAHLSEKHLMQGVLLWKITDVRRRQLEAASDEVPTVYSQPFYTSPCGYKMCARLSLHGEGVGKGTHLSLFFIVIRGEFDSLLSWPFRQEVTFVLIDQGPQRNHVSDAFCPNLSSPLSLQLPYEKMNISSGRPRFLPLAKLDSGTFIKDDCMFVKVQVDLSGIERPDERQ